MQQAARVADRTAFFTVDTSRGEGSRVGTLVEHDVTDVMFSSPSDQRTLDYVTGKFG
jgi:phosphate transport system ATP-binding protein